MNVLSLFSGIGGLDLGLQRAGMTIAGQVEIDPWCRKILAKHWPEVPRRDDVRTAAEWWGDRAVDVVAGGVPCQPTSRARQKRKAQADSRWLWPAMADTIRRLRPRFVLLENPPGLLDPVTVKDDQDRVVGYARAPIEDILGDLAALGYDAEWDCVPAAFVGAPHIRERVFVVAYNHGEQLRMRARGFPGKARTGTGEAPERQRVRADSRDGGPALADADVKPLVWPSVTRSERNSWPAEPGVGRLADGVPRRVDRLRGLGNAVVPQVAEHIGRLIMEAAA